MVDTAGDNTQHEKRDQLWLWVSVNYPTARGSSEPILVNYGMCPGVQGTHSHIWELVVIHHLAQMAGTHHEVIELALR